MKTTNLGKKYLIHSGKVIPNKEVDSHLAAAPVLKMKEYANKPLVGIVKDGVHFDGYVSVIASWFCVIIRLRIMRGFIMKDF